MTLPTPPITPSTSRSVTSPGGRWVAASAASPSMPHSMRPMAGSAQANSDWNISSMMATNTPKPQTGCSSTPSSRSAQEVVRAGGVVAAGEASRNA